MSKETLEILVNKEVIAVDQDALGVQGFQYSANGVLEIWFKPLSDDAWAMCVLNRSPRPQKILFDWKTKTVTDGFSKREAKFGSTVYSVRDLWARKDIGTTREPLNADVPSHDVVMVRLNKSQ